MEVSENLEGETFVFFSFFCGFFSSLVSELAHRIEGWEIVLNSWWDILVV